ncbi:omega-amidase NIT2-like [Sitodiplosis mosellana]|uniref:omega-amidase NIT2-like n=1 Tax=Sitodiplosis mosellana TaxID=263140 RepID=UPI0024446893|nr:omega-amidase NIT2-like [Sitodiplosis mosellana]
MATARKTKLGIALIQFDTKPGLKETLQHLSEMVEQAVSKYRPRVISVQEGFNYFYQSDKGVFENAGEPINGPTAQHMSGLAKRFNIYLIGGIAETDNIKLYNTALVFNPNGELIARHRKVNLCDIDFTNGTKLDEVNVFTPGDEVTIFKIDDIQCGLVICWDACYDEFIKIYRKLGVEVLFVPAAYDILGGDKYSLHNYWEIVHKARAFDNQMFVAAISGARNEKVKDYVLYGHTMLIDPQGKILKQAGVNEEIVFQEIDVAVLAKLYKEFPTFRLRRKDIYEKYSGIYTC